MVASTPQLRLDVTDDDRIRDGDPEATLMLLYDWKDRLNRAFDQMARDMGDARTIRTADGSSLDRRIADVDAKEQKFPESYPLVPVYLLGDYTDDFDLTDGLTGPYSGIYISNAAISADGQLTFSGTIGASTSIAECGRVGGSFLPLNADFAIETAVTDMTMGAAAGIRAGIGANDVAAGGLPLDWLTQSGRTYVAYNRVDYLGRNQVVWYDGTAPVGIANVGYTPSTTNPVFLRIEYDHATTTVTYKYKGDAEGSWTTAASHNLGAGFWSAALDVFTIITASGVATQNASADFDYLTVEYTPSNTGGHYAFIPTEAFESYKQNHIYVKKTDGTYLDIDPADAVIDNSPLIVWDRNMGVFKRWDGTDYVRIYTLPALHRINDTTYHTGVPDAVEDNFASFDEYGLPKDSDENAASFARPEHTHAGWSIYRDYFLELV